MTFEKWANHIVEVMGLPAAPPVVEPATFNEAVRTHKLAEPNCKACNERRRTIRAARAAHERNEAYRNLGMKPGRDSQGRRIWE